MPTRVPRIAALAAVVASATGCAPEAPEPAAGAVEAVSLSGRSLVPPEPNPEFRAEQGRLLAEARAALEADPRDAEARIWVGRRTAYLGRYREAIQLFTAGIEAHPQDPRFLRHRGHRYLTTRRPDLAVADLERAAVLVSGRPDEIEPDGLPNARNVPTSTLNANIWYHLGLARWVQGDFEAAAAAYREALAFSRNPDMLCASSHWLYMALRRLGRDEEARAVLEPVHEGLDVIENHDYWRLLLMYKGARDPETLLAEAAASGTGGTGYATTAYGVGHWYLVEGDRARAREIFERLVAGDAWAAFGHLAAEAELARGV